jgi:ABC-type long-subunit fatty acid transport system fused permease/ATPase subunit
MVSVISYAKQLFAQLSYIVIIFYLMPCVIFGTINLVVYVLLSDVFTVDKSPVAYFLEEMYNGNSLRSTTTLGNEIERERVYDTIFRLPWRCELVHFLFSNKRKNK